MNDLTKMLLSMNKEVTVRADEIVRAPMGYPGAKSRSIKDLLPHLPYREVFVDACAGSGSVLFARHESPLEVFNEKHAGITAFYRCLRDIQKYKELMARLEIVPGCSREEFNWARDTWEEPHHNDVERAARWYYALRHSFSQKGWHFGRTTAGRGQAIKYFNGLELFPPVHQRLQGVYIENLDYKVIFNDYKKLGREVVWYIDPPYWRVNRSYDHEWSEADHYELCQRIQDLNGGYVVVSGYDHPEHPYNNSKVKWYYKHSWNVQTSMLGLAFQESNNLAGLEDTIERGELATETIWVYAPKG